MKILVVDDKKENLYLLERMIKKIGYEVAIAENGKQALEKLYGDNFEMVISDILMPVMDGFQLCKAVKSDEKFNELLFVFYTATYVEKEDEEFALKLGADEFLRKPLEPEKFIGIIKDLIQKTELSQIKPSKIIVKEEQEILKLYSERLIHKLEQKLLALEKSNIERKRIEEELNKTKLRLEHLLTSSPATIYACKPKGDYQTTFMSENVKEISGYEAQEFLDNPKFWENAIHLEDRQHATASFYKISENDFYSQVYRFQHKNGAYHWLLEEANLIRDDQGKPLEIIGYWTDITKLKQTEKALKKQTHELGERIKELNCLFGISKLLEEPLRPFKEIFPHVLALIPPAWQYPEITCVRIVLEGKTFMSDNFHQTPWKQVADIKVLRKQAGILEVYYLTEMPEIDEGPFLKEERYVINSLARTLGEYIERRRAYKYRLKQNSILLAINKVFREVLKCETDNEVGAMCITVAQELTGSEFGFIGEINQDGSFDTVAQAMTGWDACKMPKSDAMVLIKNMEIRGIWGRVLNDEKSLIVNDPASHPDSVGTPEGHPELKSFMGVPLKHAGKTFGMIALANKESGYNLADQEAVETLSVAFVEALNNKRMEEALRRAKNSLSEKVEERTRDLYEENRRIETIIEAIPNGILVLDETGSLSLANKSFKDLYQRIFQQEIPRDFNIYNQPDHHLLNDIKRLVAIETNNNEQIEVKPHTIEPVKGLYLQLHFADITIPGERLGGLGVIIELRDVTKFMEFDNLRKQFVSTVSHELRTPITAIDLSIMNLKELEESLSTEEKDQLIEMIAQSSSLLNQMIEDLLIISRIEAGRFDLKLSSYWLLEILDSAKVQLEKKRIAKGLIIQSNVKPEIEMVGDPKRISQIFRILLDNAIKYSPEKSIIKINAIDHYQGDYNPTGVDGILIQVSDTGLGISEEDLPHMFERFFRSSMVREIEGTGLGLSIAKEIVLLHQGEIFVESELGKGSTFSVFLPVKQNMEEKT